MGQKVSPHGFRVGVIQDWDSKWYASKKDFADNLVEDNKVRDFLKKELYASGVSKVLIERKADKLEVSVLSARPGMVIGHGGEGIDQVKAKVEKLTGKSVILNIVEIKRPEMDAYLTAESIAQSLEKRVSFRRAMKQAIQRTMKAGAKGIKVVISGRVGGAEIARSEKYSEGNVPLHTLRANIDYGFCEADTQYGRIGVKVWINNGEVLGNDLVPATPAEPEKKEGRGNRRDGDRRQRRDGDRRERRDGDRRQRRDGRSEERETKKFVNPRVRPAKPVEAPAAEVEAPAAEVEAPAAEE